MNRPPGRSLDAAALDHGASTIDHPTPGARPADHDVLRALDHLARTRWADLVRQAAAALGRVLTGEAEDVVQSALVVACHDHERYEPGYGVSLAAWVAGIVRRVALGRRSAAARRAALLPVAPDHEADDVADETEPAAPWEQVEEVSARLSVLPAEERAVVWARAAEARSWREVADAAGLTVNVARALHDRGMARLRRAAAVESQKACRIPHNHDALTAMEGRDRREGTAVATEKGTAMKNQERTRATSVDRKTDNGGGPMKNTNESTATEAVTTVDPRTRLPDDPNRLAKMQPGHTLAAPVMLEELRAVCAAGQYVETFSKLAPAEASFVARLEEAIEKTHDANRKADAAAQADADRRLSWDALLRGDVAAFREVWVVAVGRKPELTTKYPGIAAFMAVAQEQGRRAAVTRRRNEKLPRAPRKNDPPAPPPATPPAKPRDDT